MSANNRKSNSWAWLPLVLGLGASLVGASAFAVQGLDASGNSKVNNSLAKKWSKTDTSGDGYNAQQDKRTVNVGSKRSNNCNVNVGTVQAGQKAPKEIVVTTKEVINVCK